MFGGNRFRSSRSSGRLLSVPDTRNKRSPSAAALHQLYTLSMSEIKQKTEFSGFHFKPSPFYIRWVYGFNHRAGVINLNDKGTSTVFYAACNFGVLYNWTTNHMRILQGHRQQVTCIAADVDGKWLVTGDSGSENAIIIWDTTNLFPQRTIFNPHHRLAKLALSGDAKYLLTVGYGEKANLSWWIWSEGKIEPHATTEVAITKDSILAMEFNPDNSMQFAFLTKQDLWIGDAAKIILNERGLLRVTDNWRLQVRNPEKKHILDLGRLTCFCFVKTTSQIIVATSRGGVMLFGYTLEYTKNANCSDINNLKYIKSLKIQKHKINVIKYVDGILVTGDTAGQIYFYDDQMKLLYWVHGFTVDNVRGLSFNISPRSYMILDPKCNTKCQCWEKIVATKHPETGELTTKLVKKKLPQDCTKGGLPFVVRDFIICGLNNGIGFVDFVTEKNNIILDYKISPVLAQTVHPEKKLICLGYTDGNVELVNFTQHKLRSRLDLREFYKIVTPPKDDSIKGDFEYYVPQLSVTCLKYSPSGLHLACGLNTGQILFLDPTTIDIITKTPFKDTKFAIKEFNYAPDSLTMAFADKGKTVGVYKYDCERMKWTFIGKHRAHYKEITSVFFLPEKNPNGEYKLVSLGMDRIMVEYDIGASSEEYLELLSLDRIDQSAIPLAGIPWPVPKDLDPETCHEQLPSILVANDEHKYKIINYATTMTLATYLGPRFDHPVQDIRLVKKRDETTNEDLFYLLFTTKIVIGLQKMPLDGNPWKHAGMLGHPNQLIKIGFREDTGTLFSIGLKDSCMCQWSANFGAVEKTTKLGGTELDPYYCLVENGRPGWLFQEIRDLFYYIQILCQGTFSPAMRRVKDYIPIESLPDLMRALGYFPSEYEVENLIVEAKFKVYNKRGVVEIDFDEFVKLYLNHRPAFGDNYRKIKHAFKVFSRYSKDSGDYMRRDDFVDLFCDYGECFSRELAWYLFSILAGQSFEDRAAGTSGDFSFLPPKVKLNDITTMILGIPDFDALSEVQSLGGQSIGSAAGTEYDSDESDDRFFKF
ncbi:cilia- and flagella-associated protein 251-like [Pectinophora gossypiella]|uniref:cilia- and flagella-associated protein 251-like n=1 Tax=Pectinophora gossypiella TaxID=13191 RepID=UPI00214E943D|nr:cilia- and flagella-associated protein 251-like [Pectinophora gossypiella]